jgi:CRISPR-associated protein Csx17
MTTFEHVLHGCASVPLGGYLKALGVFRLLAEQADPDLRGFWRDERFVLHARLPNSELLEFFIERYRPTPIVAPWNGGSGFWPKDNREGFDAIQASSDSRLRSYKAAILACQGLIRDRHLSTAPKENAKADFIAALRTALSDEACRWLDGALTLTADGPRYPPILGTGGNDGRLDFSNNFMRRQIQVMREAIKKSEEMLRSSLFSRPCAHLEKGAVGQFYPGTAGGPNAGVGFETDSLVNPWEFILTIEGALVFAASATRRHAHDRTAALAFPFTTRTVGAGSGAAAFSDEADARGEFWAPLWSRAAGFDEVLQLMSEGRAVVDGGGARDGLDFARAAAQLGTARGIQAFQRHAFLMRAGKAYFATPLGQIGVRENPRASFVSQLEANGWLSRARNAVRDRSAPAILGTLGRGLDEALFRLVGHGSAEAIEQVIVAVGAVAIETARRPKLRESLPPPPRLSTDWAEAADDGSHEFALAAALASIDATTNAKQSDLGFDIPFRCHLGPLSPTARQDTWSDTTLSRTLAVWTGRSLVRDMVAVLERRLIEARRHNFIRDQSAEIPLAGRRTAPLAAITAFLAGRTDDDRIAALAAGLAWTRLRARTSSDSPRGDALPFAYAALKPLFAPGGVGPETIEKRMLDPLPLVRLIRAGRAADAVTFALRMAHGAGLSTPFAALNPELPLDSGRLAAALLFPVAPKAHERLMVRAYPELSKEDEDRDAP